MSSSKKLLLGLATFALAVIAGIALKYHRYSDDARTGAPTATVPIQAKPRSNPPQSRQTASSASKPQMEWAKQYGETGNYFDFVAKAARSAYDGDGKAAFYISKALYLCAPIARQYAHSSNPSADFDAYWSRMTKAPPWVLDKARTDFQSCKGFIDGNAFADLPQRPDGYNSAQYWADRALAADDPLAQSVQAGADFTKVLRKGSIDPNSKDIIAVQTSLNSAVASQDAAALFHAGLLLSDGRASKDPLQGFAVSLAACDLGYDCSSNNEDLFQGCVSQGTCAAGSSYADLVKSAVGEDGYAKAYARAQQLENAMQRGDVAAAQQFVQLHP